MLSLSFCSVIKRTTHLCVYVWLYWATNTHTHLESHMHPHKRQNDDMNEQTGGWRHTGVLTQECLCTYFHFRERRHFSSFLLQDLTHTEVMSNSTPPPKKKKNNVNLVLGSPPALAQSRIGITHLSISAFEKRLCCDAPKSPTKPPQTHAGPQAHFPPSSAIPVCCFFDLRSIMTQGGEQRTAKTKIKSLAKSRLGCRARKGSGE